MAGSRLRREMLRLRPQHDGVFWAGQDPLDGARDDGEFGCVVSWTGLLQPQNVGRCGVRNDGDRVIGADRETFVVSRPGWGVPAVAVTRVLG